MVQSSPIVKAQSSQQVEHADQVLSLFSDLRHSLKYRYQAKTLRVTHKQAESLVGFVQRAVPSVRAEFDFDQHSALVKFSYQLPSWLFSHYINATVRILPDSKLTIDEVGLGRSGPVIDRCPEEQVRQGFAQDFQVAEIPAPIAQMVAFIARPVATHFEPEADEDDQGQQEEQLQRAHAAPFRNEGRAD